MGPDEETRVVSVLVAKGADLASRGRRRLSRGLFGTVRPSLLIIGAQKAGTTALFEYLAHHRQIAPPRKKEINYFACDCRFARGSSFYDWFFPARTGPRDSRMTLDASPHYLLAARRAAPRIRSFDPTMRLIVILRDPVERAYSAWQMHQNYRKDDEEVFQKWVCRCDGQEALSEYRPRREQYGTSFYDDIVEELDAYRRGEQIAWPVLRHGHYADQIAVYLEEFPADQLMIIDSEKLLTDPLSELREVERFIGLGAHEWRADDVGPRFVGDYSEPLPHDARQLLSAHYEPHNVRLQSVLRRTFDWG